MKPIQLFDIKTRTLGFAFCQPPKKVLTKLSHPKKSHYKISKTQKKSSDRKFQTQKRALHIPITYIPEYPPGDSFHVVDVVIVFRLSAAQFISRYIPETYILCIVTKKIFNTAYLVFFVYLFIYLFNVYLSVVTSPGTAEHFSKGEGGIGGGRAD